MPKFDLDKDESVFSPLEFTIDGKTFTVTNCSKKAIDKIENLPLHKQFATLCNVDPKEVELLNFFKIRAAMTKFFDAIMKPVIAEAESLIALKERALERAADKATDSIKKDEAIKKEKNGSRDGPQK